MNETANLPIDIEEQRNWIIDFRKGNALSWAEVAKRTGIPQGTLSQFGSDRGYAGDEQKVADKVYLYRQLLASQAALDMEAPEVPGYFECETSLHLVSMLRWAQGGRMGGRVVVAATGPGTCKSSSATHYASSFPNVFYVLMAPSNAGVNNMQQEVAVALGLGEVVGTPQKLTRMICDRLRNLGNPLLIFDEAQHMSAASLEEIRGWHDRIGVGLALFGNIGVMQRLEGTSRKADFAQLFSRVGMRLIRMLPLQADMDALAQAWNIHGPREIAQIRKVASLPGGLRNATKMLELGAMMAASENAPLAADHMQDAWAQLSSRAVAA
ncbi:AAA family ATPase [Novosphingobium sp. MBES04]|uniref:AAA family ATPase n=1 Tax=Novosphingobium sp. MBES04 TaxID=1206458 RepID=UPI00057C91A5|nr:AAA family ATPase [Novosphingobium sp. MBES04]GAM04833.1 ATPase [Novosphingobium sp. MBES04]